MPKDFREGDANVLPRETANLQFTSSDFAADSEFMALPAGGSSLDGPKLLVGR